MQTKIIPDVVDEQDCADTTDRRDAITAVALAIPETAPAYTPANDEVNAVLMMQEIGEYLETIESRLSATGSAGAAYVARLRNYALQIEAYHLAAIEDLTA